MIEQLINKLKKTDKNLEARKWTNLGVGGKPLFTFFPEDINEIIYFVKNKPSDLKYRTLGAGSNILIRDKGYDGVFIRLNKNFRTIKLENNELIVDAGTTFIQLTQFCIKNEIGGLEFISTIPGQIGGLTKMNAGIPEVEMKNVINWVEIINEFGEKVQLSNADCNFSYRKSDIQNNWIITKTSLKTEYSSKIEIQSKISKLKEHRKSSQPILGKMAGCFFKNPEELKAWKIIENTKINSYGQTYISNKHKNFILADKSSNAEEIEYLIESIRSQALFQQGVFLESEVEKMGLI